jgi:hypothetical protein
VEALGDGVGVVAVVLGGVVFVGAGLVVLGAGLDVGAELDFGAGLVVVGAGEVVGGVGLDVAEEEGDGAGLDEDATSGTNRGDTNSSSFSQTFLGNVGMPPYE